MSETQAENEQICEKLLGWERRSHNKIIWWQPSSMAGEFVPAVLVVPSFTTWADAGLILDAIAKTTSGVYVAFMGHAWAVHIGFGQQWLANTCPLAIRAAALEYIKAVRS